MKIRFVPTCLLLAFTALLPGCDLYEEGHLSENRLQVVEDRYVEKVPVSALSESSLSALGEHYNRHGDGPVDLTMVYDPQSRSNTAMHASTELARLTKALRVQGIRNVNGNILPVADAGDEPQAIISFTSYDARPPENCPVMHGIEDTTVDNNPDYKFGCSVDTVFAKQIARPKDLAGQARNDGDTDGRRASNIVEGYRTGQPNEPLGGESATGN